MRTEAMQEVVEVTGALRRPGYLSESAQAWKRHVFKMPRMRNVLGPKLCLRTQYALAGGGVESGCGLIVIDGLERSVAADSLRFIFRFETLIVVEIGFGFRRHDHIVARVGCSDAAGDSTP